MTALRILLSIAFVIVTLKVSLAEAADEVRMSVPDLPARLLPASS